MAADLAPHPRLSGKAAVVVGAGQTVGEATRSPTPLFPAKAGTQAFFCYCMSSNQSLQPGLNRSMSSSFQARRHVLI